MGNQRAVPDDFIVDMILKAPSSDIMNKLARSILALYSYDNTAEDKSIESELKKAMSLIAKMPVIMTSAYHVKKRHYCNESLIMHTVNPKENTAQSILSLLRKDRQYTKEEAQLLDVLLMLHAEHGGGNNSTFSCRVLTSSGTDAYSAYAAAVGSLKGSRHGGANIKVMQMLEDFERNVKNWEDEGQVADHIRKVLRKEANDGSGLIYGMGHAVYSVSDPRARIFRNFVQKLSEEKNLNEEFELYSNVERLAPIVIAEERKIYKGVSANVDFYSGFVYRMLNIPTELYTPIFAISRIAGWSAHRIEELINANKIIRPAYKAVAEHTPYRKISDR